MNKISIPLICKYKKVKFSFLYFLFFPIIFLLASCSVQNNVKYRNETEDRPLVLTTFTILADMAKQVAGNRLDVKSITKPGAEIHGYIPTPSDLVKASKAVLIIENGLGLELWSRKFTASAGDIPTVVLTQGITPLLIEGDLYSGKPNPHAWMSPKRAMVYVDNLVKAFSKFDSEGSQIYEENGNKYNLELSKLDNELREKLKVIPSLKRVLVSCEGAFTYLANDYDLDEAYLWPVNAESQVTPRRMLNLIRLVKSREVPAVFCETTVNSKAQLEVARSTGAKFGGNFYVDSLSTENGPAPTLLDLQRYNVRLLIDGLLSKNESTK